MIQGKMTLSSNPGTDFDWSKRAVHGLFWGTNMVQRRLHLVYVEGLGLCLVDWLHSQSVCMHCVSVRFLQEVDNKLHSHKYQ